MYPAFAWSAALRAIIDISAHAIWLADGPQPGHLGHHGSDAPGIPILHRRLILSQTLAGEVLLRHRWLLTSHGSFACSGGRSFSRPCACRCAAARGRPGRPSCCPDLLALLPPGCALTALRTAPGSSRSGRRLLRLEAREGASLVEDRPGDPGELVGERNRQHVVVQSFLGSFDPGVEAIALPTPDLDQHNSSGFYEQRAQVAIAAP